MRHAKTKGGRLSGKGERSDYQNQGCGTDKNGGYGPKWHTAGPHPQAKHTRKGQHTDKTEADRINRRLPA